MSVAIGIDVGGTFTDFVIWQDGIITIHKVPSTHPRPEIGVVSGLRELGIISKKAAGSINPKTGADVTGIDIIHGSTIATNALLERKGAKVGLVTTMGFTDLIDIGRQNRPERLASAMSAAECAVQTVLSGPAGGAVASKHLGNVIGFNRLISFDMGGTSTDVSLIDGDVQFTTEFNHCGMPIKIPMVDIQTVGAGGGSIAWIDAGGAFQVGPESAGSNPGPACYGQGEKPTITDANVILGRLHADRFLGGKKKLDLERARRVIDDLADECGLSATWTADGIIKIAISNMQRAVRRVSVERGYDPRDFTLIAFGGAGPMHACELAEAMLIPRVLIPKIPGVFSAYGMTVSDAVKDYSISILKKQSSLTPGDIHDLFAPLLDRAKADLLSEGFSGESVRLEESLDIRYVGQSFELTVPIVDYNNDFASDYHALHKERYGHSSPGEELEVVTIRVRAIGLRKKPEDKRITAGCYPPIIEEKTRAYFDSWHETNCYSRENLIAGQVFRGPALIFQFDTTVVIPPAWGAEIDEFGNMLLRRTGDLCD